MLKSVFQNLQFFLVSLLTVCIMLKMSLIFYFGSSQILCLSKPITLETMASLSSKSSISGMIHFLYYKRENLKIFNDKIILAFVFL